MSRHMDTSGGIHRDRGAIVPRGPSQERREVQGVPAHIQPRDEHVALSMIGTVVRSRSGREIARERLPHDVHMAGAVHRDRIALVVPRTPQEGGVDEPGAGRIEHGDERVGAGEGVATASEGSIERPGGGREIRSSGGSRDVRVAH